MHNDVFEALRRLFGELSVEANRPSLVVAAPHFVFIRCTKNRSTLTPINSCHRASSSAPYHSIEELERDRGEKVWLVRLTGSLYDLAAPPTTSASTAATPTSSPGPDCREFWVITRDGVPVLFTLLVKSSCS